VTAWRAAATAREEQIKETALTARMTSAALLETLDESEKRAKRLKATEVKCKRLSEDLDQMTCRRQATQSALDELADKVK
jgi:hypothetical protein